MSEKFTYAAHDEPEEFYNDFAPSPFFRDLPGGFADAGHTHSSMLLGDINSDFRAEQPADLQPVNTPAIDIFVRPAAPQHQTERVA